MKKALVFTLILWAAALTGYAQSFSVPIPKALQSSSVPTWPVNHTVKPNNLQLTSTSKNVTATLPSAPPKQTITAVPALPLIKLWLITEDDN